jgi:hypothetical protein
MARKGGRNKRGPNRSATRTTRSTTASERPLSAVPPGGDDHTHDIDSAPDSAIDTDQHDTADGDHDFGNHLRGALRSKDLTAFTTLVSSMLSVTDAWWIDDPVDVTWPDDDLEDDDLDHDPAPLPLSRLLDFLFTTSYAETTAALHVVAALLPDDLDAARVRRTLATRRHPVPLHVSGVRDIAVEQAASIGDDLGDGDNILLGLTWPGIGGVTVVVYIDEAFGTRVKDVFLLAEPFEDVCERYRELLASEGRTTDLSVITLADARASVEHALERGDDPEAFPIPDDWSGAGGEPLGWPMAHPFVEMVLRRMPGGGVPVLTSSGFPDISSDEAVDEFLASPHATGLGLADDVLEDAAFLVAGAAEAFVGHPWRWSPVQVELALTQRIPWATDATDEALRAVEQVLPAFIRYAHQRLAVPRHATHETIAAVDEWMPEFHALCATPAIADFRATASMIAALQQGDFGPIMLHSLAEQVGGPEALDALDDAPLPTEPLVLDHVPADVHPVAREISALVDGWLEASPRVAHLGAVRDEWRTASHRLLAAAAANDPGWLRRRASVPGRACGLLWATGIANRLIGPNGAARAKDLAADFGVSGSPSTKAEAMLRAWANGAWPDVDNLRDPALLVSTRRASMIETRDAYRH